MNDKKVLVVGELNIDLIFNHIAGFPAIGEEILADGVTLAMGSSSAIFACNLSTLGIHTSFCGKIGADNFGQFMLKTLEEKQVDAGHVQVSAADKTGITVVLNYADDRANITYPGAMDRLTIADVPLHEFHKYDHLHFSSFFLQKGIRPDVPDLFRQAKEAGLSTSLDLQWDPANEWDFPINTCLPFVDVFFLNKSEALSLTHKSTTEDAASELGKYASLVVIKLGAEGALANEGHQLIHAKPYLHEQFVDAIGAGDSFNAGFIAKYLANMPTGRCLEFANLCGAVNTTSMGGTSAFSSIDAFNHAAREIFNIQL